MSENNALYAYGIIKSNPNLDWKELGLNGKEVYLISEGKFSALVHNCEEKPYIPPEPNEIKELIIAHNKILDKAMKDFDGIIPLSFNTIIKKGENSSHYNLRKWLGEDQEKLEKFWDKIKGKKEYGIRIYYDKDKLIREASSNTEIKEIKEVQQEKSEGLSYLLEGKVKSKINEIIQNKINQFKKEFYAEINRVTEDAQVNVSRIFIKEEKDLLVGVSVLVDKEQINKIKGILENYKDFSFQLAGPFAPYSFVGK